MVLSSDATRKRVVKAKVGAAVNALSLCRDNLKVVVAGRSLLKVYTVDHDQFQELINLHIGRRTVSFFGIFISVYDVITMQGSTFFQNSCQPWIVIYMAGHFQRMPFACLL